MPVPTNSTPKNATQGGGSSSVCTADPQHQHRLRTCGDAIPHQDLLIQKRQGWVHMGFNKSIR